ncbi:hypothetical protein FOZ63_011002, partial [Perkinsus olseni]
AYYSRTDSESHPSSSPSRAPSLSEDHESERAIESGPDSRSEPHLGVLLGSGDCVNGSTVPLSTSLQSSQHALSREIRQLHQRVEEGTYNDYELLVQTCIPSTGILNTAKVGRYREQAEALTQAVSQIDEDCRGVGLDFLGGHSLLRLLAYIRASRRRNRNA